MIPKEKFVILTPLAPHAWMPFFWDGGVGWGSKFFWHADTPVWWPLCVDLDPGPEFFFLMHRPPNQWRGSRVRTPGTPGQPLYGPLPVTT